MDRDAPPGAASVLSEDESWERIGYFLERVALVAESNRVRLACHPHDPFTPSGYRGVTRVLGTVEGLKRFVRMRESPYHGLNFCQGTVAEMLDDPPAEIPDVIRWFSHRGKIFNVHLSNIRGRNFFMEAFPDEATWICAALKVCAEVGYRYMVMPDHGPALSADPDHAAAGSLRRRWWRAAQSIKSDLRTHPATHLRAGIDPMWAKT